MRHAEPVFSDERRRFLGRSDPPLSAVGSEQAHRLAERLSSVPFDSVFSSDLERCLSTARIVAEQIAAAPGRTRPQVVTDQRFREIDCGLWEGLTSEEAAARYPIEYAERERDVVGTPFPGGESFLDLRARVLPALHQVLDQGSDNVLVVSHLGVARVLVCEYRGLPLSDLFSIKLEHAGVVLLKATTSADGVRRIAVHEET